MQFRHLNTKDTVELLVEGGWVTLSYIKQSDCFFLMSAGYRPKWPSEILRKGEASLRFEGGVVSGSAELVSDVTERRNITEMFRSKYGDERFNRWFSEPGRLVKIKPSDAAGKGSDAYYRWLESEFDAVASDYDRHITGNSINMLLRERSLALMESVFSGSGRLLDIGCGSGMETVPLLKKGHEIVAADISSSMLEVLHKKAVEEGVSERLVTRKLRANSIDALIGEFGEGSFDGCYSTYGALNCEQSLQGVSEAVHALLRDDGRFVAGIYNRYCISEIMGYGLTFRFNRILKRARSRLLEGDSRFCIDVFPYSVMDAERIFSPLFSIDDVIGVPVILPPSDLDAYARKFSRHQEKIRAVDKWLGTRWPFNSLGDHFLMTLSRRACN